MKVNLVFWASLFIDFFSLFICCQAFAVCESLLEGYPAKKFVLLTLDTMTRLAVQSLVNVAPHVARLLQLLVSDPRHDIHLCCLRNLCLLARRGPHLWQTSDVEVAFFFKHQLLFFSLFLHYLYQTSFWGLQLVCNQMNYCPWSLGLSVLEARGSTEPRCICPRPL